MPNNLDPQSLYRIPLNTNLSAYIMNVVFKNIKIADNVGKTYQISINSNGDLYVSEKNS